MIKYQTLITTAFQDYPAEACIEYDRHFRQLAAKDKKVPWDKYKEDIFVWCFSPKPTSTGMGKCHRNTATIFVTANQPSCHVLAQPQDTVTHTSTGAEICIRFTQQLSWLPRGVQRQSKTRTRLPINPKLLLLLIQSILSNRHLIKYDRYLYATAISIAYFRCPKSR